LQESMMIALILTRRRTNAVSTEPAAWLAGIIGTFMPMLFRTTDVPGMVAIGAPIQIAGLLLSSIALASLGRSFGLVPAHRGIQTSGMYNFIRHPMYTAHLVGYLGYLISYPSPRNAVIGTVTALALNVRAIFEERLLNRDPSYAAYLRRVAWRFLPRLY
jgi:protein-S-isoprenylcysteine O-methyltransferase Ste14